LRFQVWLNHAALRALGIEFASLFESLDTGTTAGRMVFTVLGAVAELEHSLIVERVKADYTMRRASGCDASPCRPIMA
jgi:DNA invertase Pin-like site-specific DNA recombinase